MKILITGAAGFIASHTVNYLQKKDNITLILTDNRALTYKTKCDFYRIDLSSKDKLYGLLSDTMPDLVIHYASLVDPRYTEDNPLKAYLINVGITMNLIDACIKNNIQKFIYPSSCAVYGNNNSRYINEDERMSPFNVYSKTKEISETILRDISLSNNNFNYIALRIFRVVGSYKELSHTEDENFMNPIRIAARAAIGMNEKFTINGKDYNTEDGTVERDYIHIDDVMEMQYLSIKYIMKNNESNVFNCATGVATSLLDIVKSMSIVSEVDINVDYGPSRENEYIRQTADLSKVKKYLNWSPNITDIEDMCRLVYEIEKRND